MNQPWTSRRDGLKALAVGSKRLLFRIAIVPKPLGGFVVSKPSYLAVFDDTSPAPAWGPSILEFCLRWDYVNSAAKRRAQRRNSSFPTKAELICT